MCVSQECVCSKEEEMRGPKPTIGRTKVNIRGLHGTLSAMYIIIGGFFLGAPIICINYEFIFQAGLAGWMPFLAAWMLSMTIIGKEICLTRGEFHVLARHIFMIMFAAAAFIFATSYWVFNIVDTLMQCPSFHLNNTEAFTAQHSESVLSIASSERAALPTSLTEDQAFHRLRAAKCCRNEQGFGIALLILLLITDIICLITIFVYWWIYRKLLCMFPDLKCVTRC